jgi:hypothetical protein
VLLGIAAIWLLAQINPFFPARVPFAPTITAQPTTRPPATRPPVTVPAVMPSQSTPTARTGVAPRLEGCGAGALDSGAAETVVGKQASVYIARVNASSPPDVRGNPTFLNDAPFPNHRFTALIWGENLGLFPSPPTQLYDGKAICVSGTVTIFQGKPQIVVNHPSQIRIP